MQFLQEDVVPTLIAMYPDADRPDKFDKQLWFQQDGAPPHYALPVRTYLDDIFPQKWIGRRGFLEWPPRSPDLTPLDFFLWGHLKSKVYVNKPANIDDLKVRIQEEIRKIEPDIINRVQDEFIFRLGHCQIVNGQQFEHLIH